MLTSKSNVRLFAAAACLCLTVFLGGCGKQPPAPRNADAQQEEMQNTTPDTGFVQMGNPLVTVNSVREMEEHLGYTVPVLNKEVDSYIVLVINGVADSGRIRYADGSVFNIKKGSEDVSGIYGGTREHEKIFGSTVMNGNIVGGITVSFYVYEDIHYAIWEKDGFSFSLTGAEVLEEEVATLIHK